MMMVPRRPGPDRRHDHRREDDADQVVIEGFSKWFAFMLRHKLKAAAILSLLSTLGGYVLGVRNVQALEVRVSRVEARQDAILADVLGLKNSAKFQNYVLCLQRDTAGGSQLARLCKTIIEAGP